MLKKTRLVLVIALSQKLLIARSEVHKGLGPSFSHLSNRPFPSCFEPHYESEAKCKVCYGLPVRLPYIVIACARIDGIKTCL